jgi:hypothetical protein
MKSPDSLEQLILLLKRHGVMHYAGEVEIDFTCQACDAAREEAPEPVVLAPVTKLEPEEIDRDTGLTKSQADELFHSAE